MSKNLSISAALLILIAWGTGAEAQWCGAPKYTWIEFGLQGNFEFHSNDQFGANTTVNFQFVPLSQMTFNPAKGTSDQLGNFSSDISLTASKPSTNQHASFNIDCTWPGPNGTKYTDTEVWPIVPSTESTFCLNYPASTPMCESTGWPNNGTEPTVFRWYAELPPGKDTALMDFGNSLIMEAPSNIQGQDTC